MSTIQSNIIQSNTNLFIQLCRNNQLEEAKMLYLSCPQIIISPIEYQKEYYTTLPNVSQWLQHINASIQQDIINKQDNIIIEQDFDMVLKGPDCPTNWELYYY